MHKSIISYSRITMKFNAAFILLMNILHFKQATQETCTKYHKLDL